MPTSVKLQLISGDAPRLHEWDQRGDLFEGDAQGDHHKTLVEKDDLSDTEIALVESNGAALNEVLGQLNFEGNSLRICLMDGKEA